MKRKMIKNLNSCFLYTKDNFEQQQLWLELLRSLKLLSLPKNPNLDKDPVVYLKSPVWDFRGYETETEQKNLSNLAPFKVNLLNLGLLGTIWSPCFKAIFQYMVEYFIQTKMSPEHKLTGQWGFLLEFNELTTNSETILRGQHSETILIITTFTGVQNLWTFMRCLFTFLARLQKAPQRLHVPLPSGIRIIRASIPATRKRGPLRQLLLDLN